MLLWSEGYKTLVWYEIAPDETSVVVNGRSKMMYNGMSGGIWIWFSFQGQLALVALLHNDIYQF